ncbi:MAG TPA: hypothetical protein VNQ73_06115 [Ilumatobacter sp.]|nr:hypothetical protein [Ilumatobacter sp.]
MGESGRYGGVEAHTTRLERSTPKSSGTDGLAVARQRVRRAFATSSAPTLLVGGAHDAAETEADRVAEQVLRLTGQGSGQPPTALPGRMQRSFGTGTNALDGAVPTAGGSANRIRRLMSAKEFKEQSHEGALRVRGTTVKTIDALLAEYDALKVRSRHLDPGGGLDQAINILIHIRQDVEIWRGAHLNDTSRKDQRRALEELDRQALVEQTSLEGIRDAGRQQAVVAGDLVVKENKYKAKLDGPATSILSRLSPIIRTAIPAAGDSAEIELEVKIPVDPDGVGYAGFRIKVSAERGDGATTKIGLEAAVIGGVRILDAVDLGFELGGLIEAQGKSPEAAFELMSWGWYRTFRESALPREVANLMWGGSTGAVGWNRSEAWAAKVEEQNFTFARSGNDENLTSGVGSDSTTNAYVRTGLFAAANASGSLGGVVDAEAGARITGGRHYDRETVQHGKAKRGGKVGQPEAMPERGKSSSRLGATFLSIEASVGASVGPFSGELSGSLEFLQGEKANKDGSPGWGMRFEYVSAELSAAAAIPLNETFVHNLVNGVIALGPNMIKLFQKLSGKATSSGKSGAIEGASELATTGESVAQALNAFPPDPVDATDLALEGAEQTVSLDASTANFSIAIAVGCNLWQPKDRFALDVTISADRSLALDAGMVALSASRSRRLARLKWSNGWKPEID